MKRKHIAPFNPQTPQQIGNGEPTLNCPKTILFRRGCSEQVLYPDGKIKLTVISSQGNEAIVACWSGAFFGEGCLTGASVHGHGDRCGNSRSFALTNRP